MILLAAVDGMRRGEISRVHTDDLGRDNRLLVHGKGGRTRRVPLPPELADRIRAADPGWLFPSPVRPGRPIEPATAGKWIRYTLPPGVTPHMLRHSAASSMHLDHDLPLLELRKLLGHASVATTQIYTATSDARTAAAVSARLQRLAS